LFAGPIPSYGWYVLFVLLLIGCAELRRFVTYAPMQIYLLIGELAYIAWLSVTYQGTMFIAFFSTLVSILALHRAVERIIAMLAGFAGLIALFLWSYPNEPVLQVSVGAFYIAASVLLIQIAKTRHAQLDALRLNDELRRKHYQLEEARGQLLDYASKVQIAAQLEERNRISRDIHDELGHKLIRLKLMMDAAMQIMAIQPEKGMELLESVREQLAESMEMLRATVRRLKPVDGDLRSYSLEKLARDIRLDTGLVVDYEVSGMPYMLYPSLEVVLFRNAQEAITNAIRHGDATHIAIAVHYEPYQVTMNVSNNGHVPDVNAGRGLGLSGMEERTALVGGKLDFSFAHPFTVQTTLPVNETHA